MQCGQLVNSITFYISTRTLVFHDQAARLKGKVALNIEDSNWKYRLLHMRLWILPWDRNITLSAKRGLGLLLVKLAILIPKKKPKTCKSGFPARLPKNESILRIETLPHFPAFVRIKCHEQRSAVQHWLQMFFHTKEASFPHFRHNAKFCIFAWFSKSLLISVTFLSMRSKIAITKYHTLQDLLASKRSRILRKMGIWILPKIRTEKTH